MLIEISQAEIKMPIMAFTDNDMFIKNDKKFIIRKSSLPFYESNIVTIIDSEGKLIKIDDIQINGNMIWWNFFKDGFYDYYNVTIKTKTIDKIDILRLKEKIMLFMEQNPKYGWGKIATHSQIKAFIKETQSFHDLISFFNYFRA